MTTVKKRCLFLIGMLLTGAFLILGYLAVCGNTPQIYNDIIIEWTAVWKSNKSAEQDLLYGLAIGGALLYFLYYLCTQKKKEKTVMNSANSAETEVRDFSFMICIMTAVSLLSHAEGNFFLVCFIIWIGVWSYLRKELLGSAIVYYVLGYYALVGLYRTYVYIGGNKNANSLTLVLLFLFISFPLIFTNKKAQFLQKSSLIFQLVVPFSLLIYITSSYMKDGVITKTKVPVSVVLVIALLILTFFFEAMTVLVKNWNKSMDFGTVFSLGTCVSILGFNRFSGTGAVMSEEMHHTFENILGYSQVFELGQKLFSEYIPVSGMYSVVEGAFFKLFGNGELGNYYFANNIFYLTLVVAIVICLRKQVKGLYLIASLLLFYMVDYNRVAFILPIVLLLCIPKLVENQNRWLKVWMLTSLFHGLYYPVYGAAVCLGFLPLGIYQIITYIKRGSFKKDIKKLQFWAGWICSFIPVVIAIPWLLGTYKHIKAMAGQSILADGLSRFGQDVPDWFMPYLNSSFIRMLIFLILTFLIPAAFVWIVVAVALHVANISYENKRIKCSRCKEALISVSLAIMALVSYSFSAVRLDVGDLYARSKGMLFAGSVMLLIFTYQYIKDTRVRQVVSFAAILIPCVVNMTGVSGIDENLSAYYTVPEGYHYVENSEVEKIGTGYIEQSQYDKIVAEYEKVRNQDRELSYLGTLPSFGYYYLFDVKADSVMEIGTVKGFNAAKETIDLILENETIVGKNINPFSNYYMYHWLLDSGKYYWNDDQKAFYPNKTYSADDIRQMNKSISISWDNFELGRDAASLGMSMETLAPLFQHIPMEYTETKNESEGLTIQFHDVLNGENADFLYVEFDIPENDIEYYLYDFYGKCESGGNILTKNWMKKEYNADKKLNIIWTDEVGTEHNMLCNLSEGKLLVPLGAGAYWLFNDHNHLKMQILQNDEMISVPEIKEIRFLKLREVTESH